MAICFVVARSNPILPASQSMTTTQAKLASREAAKQYREVEAYCDGADVRLSRDPKEGFWLHYDNRMRFVRMLSDVRGWVDYINGTL
jgi:hypothetical protein